MAMKKTTPPRPGGSKTSSTALGAKKGTKVVKITKVVKPMTKSAMRNPNAPTPVGAAAPRGAVRVITPSETAMKKGKLRGTNTTPPSKAAKQTKDANTKMTSREKTMKENQRMKGPKFKGRPGLRGGGMGGGGLFGGRGIGGTR